MSLVPHACTQASPRVPFSSRVFVLSLPKAGTYLIAALLERSGFIATGWHVRLDGYEDYSTVPLDQARQTPAACRRERPLAATLEAIPPGGFAVGHLPYSATTASLLRPFRCLVLLREPRAALLSRLRFQWASGRAAARAASWLAAASPQEALHQFLYHEGPERLAHLRALAPWATAIGPDYFHLRFETLQNDALAPSFLETLYNWLDIPPPEPLPTLMPSLRTHETLTRWPGAGTAPTLFWDATCESWWQSEGGPEISRMFGYE